MRLCPFLTILLIYFVIFFDFDHLSFIVLAAPAAVVAHYRPTLECKLCEDRALPALLFCGFTGFKISDQIFAQ